MPARSGFSTLQQQRLQTGHNLPDIFKNGGLVVAEKLASQKVLSKELNEAFPATCATPSVSLKPGTPSREPLNVGVVLSGGQAPGGHNVIAGLYDYIKTVNPNSKLIGFKDGPHGIFSHNYVQVDDELISQFRNTGGFDMLGSGRHKIESTEHFEASLKVCTDLNLHGLVVIGGDDSNTNACTLGEYFKSKGAKTNVIGCPKTIDGDLKNEAIPISFGFDTACRTYAEQVGNVERDALGAQKYYHFVRLMGRSASHIALEVALQTRPNVCLIGEEVSHLKSSLSSITKQLADVVEKRAANSKNYGVILLPEGLIEFIPEIGNLIGEINELLAGGLPPTDEALLGEGKLTANSAAVFRMLPGAIREQLLLDRDPHGNVQVAKIETEMLLASTVAAELEARCQACGGKDRIPFTARFHNFGYEGRSALPSMFDADYCYALGLTAGGLVSNGLCSVMSSVGNLLAPVNEWTCGGTPIPTMMNFERRKGKWKPVIAKALVELEGNPFKAFCARREDWTLQDYYRCPGPLQFNLPPEVSQQIPLTLRYELLKPGQPDPEPHLKPDAPELQAKKFPLADGKVHLFRPTPPSNLSALEALRLSYKTELPAALKGNNLAVTPLGASQSVRRRDAALIAAQFPRTYGQPLLEFEERTDAAPKPPVNVGVVFCGRQAPGGHNIVTGLYDAVSGFGGKVLGFVAGTKGLLAGQAIEITEALIATCRNTGGFDLLGRTVDRIDVKADAATIAAVCAKLGLSALVLVGGVRTQTDASYLAEAFAAMDKAPAIIGVPTGIDGAIHGNGVELSVGFDSACHMYAQLVGNTGTDAASARKYYHFLRVMGTSPSHIALEVALRTKPNAVLLAEEVAHKRQSLQDIVSELADVVVKRAQEGKDFGIILVPEGIAAAIPELAALIDELTALQKEGKVTDIEKHLTPWSGAVYASLPDFIRESLLLERQSDNRIQLSQIESERLLAELVDKELSARKKAGTYKGKFSPVCSFLGYQARGSLPSNFDCDLAYTLGTVAAHLGRNGCNGYLAIATGLRRPTPQWRVGGMPIIALLAAEDASKPPKIPEARVELTSQAYSAVKAASNVVEEKYENPGPLQFGGSTADARPLALVAQADPGYLQTVTALHSQLDALRDVCRPGCPAQLLHVAARSLANLTDTISLFHGEDVSFGDIDAYKRRKMI